MSKQKRKRRCRCPGDRDHDGVTNWSGLEGYTWPYEWLRNQRGPAVLASHDSPTPKTASVEPTIDGLVHADDYGGQPYLYHWTRPQNVSDILEHGLQPGCGQNWQESLQAHCSGRVFLSTEPDKWRVRDDWVLLRIPTDAVQCYYDGGVWVGDELPASFWDQHGERLADCYTEEAIPPELIELVTAEELREALEEVQDYYPSERTASAAPGNKKPTRKMVDFFETRTREHIERVIKFMQLFAGFADFSRDELLERALEHDRDKYTDPNLVLPYVWVTWFHKVNNEQGSVSDELQEQYDLASEAAGQHVEQNLHHPEAHGSLDDMTPLDLVEMVADWSAMAEELGEGSARGWADKNVGSKWEFADDQRDFIYEAISWLENTDVLTNEALATKLQARGNHDPQNSRNSASACRLPGSEQRRADRATGSGQPQPGGRRPRRRYPLPPRRRRANGRPNDTTPRRYSSRRRFSRDGSEVAATYTVVFLPSARRELKKLPRDIAEEVEAAEPVLAVQPIDPPGLKKWKALKGHNNVMHSVRVGQLHRLVYAVFPTDLVVEIHRIRPRDKAYVGLDKLKGLKPPSQRSSSGRAFNIISRIDNEPARRITRRFSPSIRGASTMKLYRHNGRLYRQLRNAIRREELQRYEQLQDTELQGLDQPEFADLVDAVMTDLAQMEDAVRRRKQLFDRLKKLRLAEELEGTRGRVVELSDMVLMLTEQPGRTSWKKLIDRLTEMHPELADILAELQEEFTGKPSPMIKKYRRTKEPKSWKSKEHVPLREVGGQTLGAQYTELDERRELQKIRRINQRLDQMIEQLLEAVEQPLQRAARTRWPKR